MKHRSAVLPVLALAALGAASVSRGQSYEPLPTLEASQFLEPAFLKGAQWTVQSAVTTDGLFNTYTIDTPWGIFVAPSTTIAMIRIHEVGAIAQLEDVDKFAVAAGAAAQSVVDMGKGAFHLVTDPVGSAKNLGDGVSRLFGQVTRGAKRTEEQVSYSPTPGTTPTPSTGDKVVSTSRGLAKSLLGVNRAQREWAHKLGVDPYTSNPVLRNELEQVADFDAGGRFSTRLLPLGIVGTVLGTANTVNNIIYSEDPDQIQTLNETRLKEMGVSSEDSVAFRLNKAYTLSIQTRLIASLYALEGVEGRAAFVKRAAGVEAEVDARFYQESAYMAEIYREKEAPILSIADMPGACVFARGDRFACLYPVDYVVWTEGVAASAEKINQQVAAEHPSARREVWLTGTVSPRTQKELEARRWEVHPKSMYVLPAKLATPAPTPSSTPAPAAP